VKIMQLIQNFSEVRHAVSDERLGKYLVASGQSFEQAIRLYTINSAVAEAFYTPLMNVEVTLRNVIDQQLLTKLGPDWLLKPAPFLLQAQLAALIDAKKKARPQSAPATHPAHGKVLAELPFSFWVALISGRYDEALWKPALHKAFSSDAPLRRAEVHGRLNAIRRFRNRVAHYEPILWRAGATPLLQLHNEIIETVRWMAPEMARLVEAKSRVPDVLATHQTELAKFGLL
jgi:hypothetical protein